MLYPAAPAMGIDLGAAWGSTGSAVLIPDSSRTKILDCQTRVLSPKNGAFDARSLADAIDAAARAHRVAAVALDGPQGWREPGSTCRGVGRHAELSARCPGKTGCYGTSYPGTYIGWVRLCIEVFDLLLSKAGVLLADDAQRSRAGVDGGYHLLECFPTSTWRASGLQPLPGHRNAPPEVVRHFATRLATAYGLPGSALVDNHDNLQAIVAALSATAWCGGPGAPRAHGVPSRRHTGVPVPHRVEGLIWDSTLPAARLPADATFEDAGDARNPLLLDERCDLGDEAIGRGVSLFRALAREANAGRSLGVSYSRFVELVYDAPFQAVVGRTYKPSDSPMVIRLATQITTAADGRIRVTRNGVTIHAGMDTFIWPQAHGHERSARAWIVGWAPIPYTRDEWRAVFPDGTRQLVSAIP